MSKSLPCQAAASLQSLALLLDFARLDQKLAFSFRLATTLANGAARIRLQRDPNGAAPDSALNAQNLRAADAYLCMLQDGARRDKKAARGAKVQESLADVRALLAAVREGIEQGMGAENAVRQAVERR